MLTGGVAGAENYPGLEGRAHHNYYGNAYWVTLTSGVTIIGEGAGYTLEEAINEAVHNGVIDLLDEILCAKDDKFAVAEYHKRCDALLRSKV